jgi:hypothetical protein
MEFAKAFFLLLLESKGVIFQSAHDQVVCECSLPYELKWILTLIYEQLCYGRLTCEIDTKGLSHSYTATYRIQVAAIMVSTPSHFSSNQEWIKYSRIS